MYNFLYINTSYKKYFIGLYINNNFEIFFFNKNFLLENYLNKLDIILKKKSLNISSIKCILCIVGPGSFIGTRIGILISKGLSILNNIPIIKLSIIDLFLNKINIISNNKKKIILIKSNFKRNVYIKFFKYKNNNIYYIYNFNKLNVIKNFDKYNLILIDNKINYKIINKKYNNIYFINIDNIDINYLLKISINKFIKNKGKLKIIKELDCIKL